MKNFAIVAIVMVILAGCQSEPDNRELLDELVVSTNFDPEAEYNAYSTYAIPTDTIGLVSNQTSDTIITANRSSFPRPVLDRIRANMEQRGYQRVSRNQSPDIGINVVVVNDFNIFQEVVYPSPFGYPGGFYSGYYGYNSWFYYPYVNTYTYNTGALVIELIDLKNRNANNDVRVIWNAYLGDIYSTIDLLGQTTEAIDQAFVQSPYLTKAGL